MGQNVAEDWKGGGPKEIEFLQKIKKMDLTIGLRMPVSAWNSLLLTSINSISLSDPVGLKLLEVPVENILRILRLLRTSVLRKEVL